MFKFYDFYIVLHISEYPPQESRIELHKVGQTCTGESTWLIAEALGIAVIAYGKGVILFCFQSSFFLLHRFIRSNLSWFKNSTEPWKGLMAGEMIDHETDGALGSPYL